MKLETKKLYIKIMIKSSLWIFIYILVSFVSYAGEEKELSVNIPNLFFSPNYDRIDDFLIVNQRGSYCEQWIGEFSNSRGDIVKSFRWNGYPENFKWDGRSEYNRVVIDGIYTYSLYSLDSYGNKANLYTVENIVLDASSPRIKLTLKYNYISPNGDGVQDYPGIDLFVPAKDKLKDVGITINKIGSEEKRIFTRDMIKTLPDGSYLIGAIAVYGNNFTSYDSSVIHISRVKPGIEVNLQEGNRYIDRSGLEKIKGYIILDSIEAENLSQFNLYVKNRDKTIISRSGLEDIVTPIDLAEYILPQGNYSIEIYSTDIYGNSFSYSNNLFDIIKFKIYKYRYYINLPPVQFEPYKYSIDYDFSEYIKVLNRYKSMDIYIESNSYNDGSSIGELEEIALKRGEFIKKQLIQNGVDSRRIILDSKGIKNSHRKAIIYLK